VAPKYEIGIHPFKNDHIIYAITFLLGHEKNASALDKEEETLFLEL
jgi:hypothetical protein